MGSLKPGATYIYERVGDTVFAREAGANPSTRKPIGYDYKGEAPSTTLEKIQEDKLWGNIRREARTNPALQKALERAILIYKLGKEKYE